MVGLKGCVFGYVELYIPQFFLPEFLLIDGIFFSYIYTLLTFSFFSTPILIFFHFPLFVCVFFFRARAGEPGRWGGHHANVTSAIGVPPVGPGCGGDLIRLRHRYSFRGEGQVISSFPFPHAPSHSRATNLAAAFGNVEGEIQTSSILFLVAAVCAFCLSRLYCSSHYFD